MNNLDTANLVIIGFGFALLLVWLFLYARGMKYANLFMVLNDEDFPMKDIYFVGYALSELRKTNFQSESQTETRKMLSVLYGNEYVDYYIRAVYSQRVSMSLTIACFALPAYCFSEGSILAFLFIIAAAIFAYIYYGRALPNKIEQRKNDMISDFSEVVSKLALLVNAGMILQEAWEKVSVSGNTEIYEEMQKSVQEMHNGRPASEAIFAFGQRCMLPEIKKFATTLIQGFSKGNAELSLMLKQQSKEVWGTKQQIVMRQGELANDKLLLPILIIFIGILIMVLVPIFSGIGG